MITRSILKEATYCLTQFRALCIVGPRQSGKTTLCKMISKGKPYINFENPAIQLLAETEPEAFLKKYKNGAILDEVQRVPHIFRYLQVILDVNTKRGQFILTGSNNFLLQEQVAQSLAGRAGYLTLLPLSYQELTQAKLAKHNIDYIILQGSYPEVWKEKLNPITWYSSYILTYIQRDVRLLKNIVNLATFNKFVALCANYAGQLVNRDELAKLVGVDTKTILSWLGLLETSYIAYTVPPWYSNKNKRLVKSSKLYFYDTGVLCNLLGIKSITALQKHAAYGAIFENWIITEIKKNRYNFGDNEPIYFYRDSLGTEVDIILEQDGSTTAIEIKASAKLTPAMYKGLHSWYKGMPNTTGIVLYKGANDITINNNTSGLSWQHIKDMM